MKTLKYVASALIVLLVVFVVWGRIEAHQYDVEEETAVISDLPATWEGQRVAQISDWQVGMWLDNLSTIRETVADIIEEEPALVLLTGDFVYHPIGDSTQEIQRVAELARPLVEAGLPTYAVLGNHDYAVADEHQKPDAKLADRVAQALEDVGVQVLRNESVPLEAPSAASGDGAAAMLHLVGLGPDWPDRAYVEQALAGVPEKSPRLVMMHNPNTYERIPANAAPLTVAGHTHGGQIRLPLLPQWSWLTFIRPGYITAEGWIDKYDVSGNRLYVNRGIGYSVLPLRINCSPELTYFTLRSETASADVEGVR